MKKIFSYFFQGLLYFVPIGVTLYVLYIVARFIYSIGQKLDIMDVGYVPGFAIAIILLFVFLCIIGYCGPQLISTPLAKFVLSFVNRAPLVRVIYTSVRDLTNALVGKERKFGTAVLVNLDNDGIVQRIGFITSEDLSHLNIKDKIAVIFPNSFGLLGELVIVPTSKITKIDTNSADIMKFIVSGGVTSIEEARQKRESKGEL